MNYSELYQTVFIVLFMAVRIVWINNSIFRIYVFCSWLS